MFCPIFLWYAKKTDESTDLSGIVKYSASVIAPKTQKKVVDYAAEKTIKKKMSR